MKPYRIATLLIVLSSCTAHRDQFFYQKTVDFVYHTNDSKSFCEALSKDVSPIDKILDESTYLKLYAAGEENNEDVQTITVSINTQIFRFKALRKLGSISDTYCQEKIKNVNDMARILRDAEGVKKL